MNEREHQQMLLKKLYDEYPYFLNEMFDPRDLKTRESIDLHYLEEHGLVEIERRQDTGVDAMIGQARIRLVDPQPLTGAAKITARGRDFIKNDGGLSAILDTVTVKLHADTIRDLIDAKIIESNTIPEQEKPALREALKGMKEEGLKQLTTRLISYGLDQGSITVQQLSVWLNI